MKIRLLLSSLTLALAFASGLHAQPAPKGGDDHEETELGGKMSKINKAYRALKPLIPDASKNEDSLKQVAIIHDAAVEASKLTPDFAKDQPADKRDAFIANYQSEMKKFIGKVDDLTAALKAGKNDDAAKIYADLRMQEGDDHKQFRKPQKKKEG